MVPLFRYIPTMVARQCLFIGRLSIQMSSHNIIEIVEIPMTSISLFTNLSKLREVYEVHDSVYIYIN